MEVSDDTFKELERLFTVLYSKEIVSPWQRLKIFYLAAAGKDSKEVASAVHPLVNADKFEQTQKKVLIILSDFVKFGFFERKHFGNYVYGYIPTARGQYILKLIVDFDINRADLF